MNQFDGIFFAYFPFSESKILIFKEDSLTKISWNWFTYSISRVFWPVPVLETRNHNNEWQPPKLLFHSSKNYNYISWKSNLKIDKRCFNFTFNYLLEKKISPVKDGVHSVSAPLSFRIYYYDCGTFNLKLKKIHFQICMFCLQG